MITQDQIDAAGRLRERLRGWDDADCALEQLKMDFPSNSKRSDVLAKASAIDKLYSTRAGNIYWVANSLLDAMQEIQLSLSGGLSVESVDVVDAVSLHKRQLYPGSSRCASFASKYCHFFVDGWEFLIYDSFALSAVKNLLGARQHGLSSNRSEYRDFCERVDRLITRDSLQDVPLRDMDRYFWLWGQWLAQLPYKEPVINRDVYDLFNDTDSSVQRDLRQLEPVA